MEGNDVLLSQIKDLQKQVRDLEAKGHKYRTERREWMKERDELRASRESSAKELEEARSRPTDEWQTKYEEVRKEVWNRDHRDAWKPVISEKLVDGVPLEEIWSKIGYSPGEATPTPAQILEHMEKARAVAPYLFRVDGTTKGGSPAPESRSETQAESNGKGRLAVPPGMGIGRGSRATGASELVLTKDQMRNPEYMRLNQRAIAQARKDNVLVIQTD